MTPIKVLIIRLSSIGDIVLTTPVLRCLKNQKEVEIHYCTKKQFSFLVENNPYIDQCHFLDGSMSQLIQELRKENFDYVIDLHYNLRTRWIKTFLNKKSYSFDKLNWEKWLLVNFKINQMPNVHIVDRYLETVKKLGVTNDGLGLEYYIPFKDEVEPEWLPLDFQKEFVAFAIGGGHYTKKLPVDRLIEVCDKINKPIVLLGGKEDVEAGNEIEQFFQPQVGSSHTEEELQKLGKKTIIFNACGKLNFNQSASLIRQSMCVFAHDTGLMHVAAAFQKKVYSFWGNTTPSLGMYPYKTNFTVFENNKISCRPCSKIGYNRCPKGHFKCMRGITLDFYIS